MKRNNAVNRLVCGVCDYLTYNKLYGIADRTTIVPGVPIARDRGFLRWRQKDYSPVEFNDDGGWECHRNFLRM